MEKRFLLRELVMDAAVIDKRDTIAAIQKKYGEKFYFNQECYAEAAAEWGFDAHNSCGVITHYRTETVVTVRTCKAEVRLAESSKGYWIIGVSAMTAISGFGYAPSVFSGIGYSSYDAARLAGVQRLLRFFQSESESLSGSAARDAAAAAQLLEAEKKPQLSLF